MKTKRQTNEEAQNGTEEGKKRKKRIKGRKKISVSLNENRN
jgi:hypothetical protein